MRDTLLVQVLQDFYKLLNETLCILLRESLIVRAEVTSALSSQVLMKTLALNMFHNNINVLVGFECLCELNDSFMV
jgi:hypothetical protein